MDTPNHNVAAFRELSSETRLFLLELLGLVDELEAETRQQVSFAVEEAAANRAAEIARLEAGLGNEVFGAARRYG